MAENSTESSTPVQDVVTPVLHGNVRLIYEHGEPHGIRDDHGFICLFNRVIKFAGQEERYQRELHERRQTAQFVLNSLRSASRH